MHAIERQADKWLILRHTHQSLDDVRDAEDIIAALPNQVTRVECHEVHICGNISISGLRDLPWRQLQKEQYQALKNQIFESGRKPQQYGIAYYGSHYLPLAMDLGYHLREFTKVTLPLKAGDNYQWIAPCTQHTLDDSKLHLVGVPEAEISHFGDVVIRVSVSHRIPETDTHAMVKGAVAEIDLMYGECSTRALTSPKEIGLIAWRFSDLLKQIIRVFPRLGRIHLFMACPVGLAFRMGTLLDNTHMTKPIQTYKYMDQGRGYTRALVLGRTDMIDPAISIQFVSAVPKGTKSLRFGEEHRNIAAQLRDGNMRDRISMIDPQLAARVEGIQKTLRRDRADIVHLSGHGEQGGT